MKTFFSAFALVLLLTQTRLLAQSPAAAPRFIEVTGSAEKTIKADEIVITLVMTEYEKGKELVKLATIEREFYAVLKENRVDTSLLNLNSLENAGWWYWWKNRDKQLKQKTFTLSLRSNVDFLGLIEDLDKKWVQSIAIKERKNNRIAEHRQEVKIEAMKAAKEKAAYLLGSIGERIGNVISVEEVPERGWFGSGDNLTSNTVLMSPANDTGEIDNVSGITLRYEIRAKFEIK